MRLIDTHQHLIWRDKLHYSWTGGIPVLATGDFTPEIYEAETRSLAIEGALFMETGVDDADYREEARFAATRVGKNGLLGQIASCRPEETDGFDSWLEECAALHVHGFRRILHVVPDEVSQGEAFRTNLRKIGKRGLTFDLCFLARQLPLAGSLLRACPDQVFVLDHCGAPDIAGGAFESWAAAIDELARFPNLNVKLSGISAYCTPGTVSRETLKPWVDHILDRFGPTRIVWGSDWPVVLLGAGLSTWVGVTRELLSGLSEDEQAQIGSLNAKAIYKLQ